MQEGQERDEGERPRIPVIWETLEVGKRVVETGRVRIIHRPVEERHSVDVPWVRERVVIERVPIERIVDPDHPPEVHDEGDVLVIPVLEEEEAVRRGGYLVSVVTNDNAQVQQIETIMEQDGAIDLDERAQQWQSEGRTDYRGRRPGRARAGERSPPASQPRLQERT